MADYSLPASELAELRAALGPTPDKREAERIKALILLASGWGAEDIAGALLIDANTVRHHFKRYQQGGSAGLLRVAYRGSDGEHSEADLAVLDAHLQTQLCLSVSAKDVAAWVAETPGVAYTVSGMTGLLYRLGFVYKKLKLVPGKADREAQEAFLAEYENLKQNKGENDVLLLMDAVHFQYNPVLGYGWIKRGEDREVPSNAGRRPLSVNGAIDLERRESVVRCDDTIDGASTIALFGQLRLAYAYATCICLIGDNACHYRSKAVEAHLQDSRIKLVFVSAYAPNLNLIERLWKFFRKQVVYDRYYETFSDFREACRDFFNNSERYHCELRSLLTENFALTG